MAVSDIDGHRQRTSFWERLLGQLTRYDLVLAVIPLAFALGLLAHVVGPVSIHLAIASGAVLSGVFLVDALYVNPPIGVEGARESTDESMSEAAEESTATPAVSTAGD